MPILDTCIITASDARQAEVFKELLDRRIKRGLYPREIDFRVYSDPPSGRVGSGGGTVWALLAMLRDEGLDLTAGCAKNAAKENIQEALARLSSRRVLMIHAGGESRRLPCYVPEGKLFAPVPAASARCSRLSSSTWSSHFFSGTRGGKGSCSSLRGTLSSTSIRTF